MKKYISYLLASALLAPVFVSCNERLQEEEIPVRTHKVLFSASQAETRTGLSIEGKTVTPDWNKTDESNIHLFETDANNATVYGETLKITMSSDKETAQFEADFPEEMTIVVGVNDDTSTGGSAARVAPYSYTAVVAQKAAGETLAFVIPAEQHPDAETLKDPNADFLVGYGAETVDAPHNYDEPVVDLYFDRAAAMGRVAISNFSDNGEKVQSVTISTTAGLTGSAALSAIDFEKATVSFTRTEGPLSLVYDNGADVPADGTFYAYFVAIPGEATISSIEVVTDQYVYTKEINKATTLSAKSFKNFTLDLSTATKEAVTPSAPAYVKVTSVDDLVVGAQYLVVFEGIPGDTEGNADPKVFDPVLDSDTQFKKNTSSALDVTITDDTIETGDYEDCQFTLEAGYYLKANKADKYLYPGVSNSRGTINAEATPTNALNITFTDKGIAEIIAKSGTYYLVWSTSSNYFSSNTPIEGDYSTGICLYKLDDGRQKQSPAFSAAEAEYDLYTKEWTKAVPSLSGAQGTVTYESSDPTVATVDASGNVTPIKKGTATITAKAAGNATYRPGQASYTVTVVSSDPSVTSYTKVTSTSGLEAGAQYLLVFEGLAGDTDGDGDPKVFNPVLNSSGDQFSKVTTSAIDVEIVNGTITSNDCEAYQFTLEEGYYLKADVAGKYIYPGSSSSSSVMLAESSASHALTIAFDNGIAKIQNGDRYLVWSTYSHYFSANSDISGQYATGICLYKLDDGRQKQSPAFSAAEAEYDLYTKEWTKAVPTLNGAQGTVTYESSNTAVATVNASSGAVTPLTKGTTTITAKAAGNATYRPGEASYTVKVVDSNPAVPKYYKVEEIEAGQTYIIVSEGQAMTMNGTTLGVVSVTDVDGVIETDEDLALWTAAEHVEYYSGTSAAGHFTLKNGDNYLQRYSNSGTQTASVGGVPSTGKYYVWEYDGTHLYHLSSASNTFYLGYSSGWKFNYQSPYYTASLYSTTKQQTKLTQSISFSTSDAKYDKATSAWTVAVPTLSGAQTDVTFSSSNEAVATVSKVDNTTVNVTIASGAKKNDTAVITATAEGTETYKSASASFTVTVDDSNSKTPEYALVESDSDIEVGAKYLLVNESNSKVFKPVLNGSNFTSAAANALSATIQNHTIVSDEFEACELALEEGYYFYVNSAKRYLYPTSSNIGAEETKSSSHSFSISIASDGVATISRTSNNSTYKLRWTSSGYFQSSTSSANCQLYKLQENGPKKRNLAFSPTSVSVNIYGKSTPIALSELTTVPTLSGNGLNDVTYSIDPSTSNVAEVTAAGVVTVKNTGTVTIKASAGATSDYQSDSATYTLTVTSTAVQTYTKATEVSVSDSYLIVSVADDKVFNGKIKTGENAISIEKPTSNTIEDAEGNFAAYVFTFEKDGDSYYLKFNDGKYLVCDYGQNTGADTGTGLLYKEKKSDVKYPYTLTINNGAFFFKTSQETAGTGNQYMYYKTDSSGSGPLSFKIGGSGSNVGIHLYKKN